MLIDQLVTGVRLYCLGADGRRTPLTLSSMFKRRAEDGIFGLVGAFDSKSLYGSKVFTSPFARGDNESIGVVTDGGSILDGGIGDLFRVVALLERHSQNAIVKPVAYSRNLFEEAFGDHPVTIRRVGRISAVSSIRHGILAGDVVGPEIEIGERIVSLPRAIRARSCGARYLGEDVEGGAPVLSKSKALLGFVIGHSDDELLILPAETVAQQCKLDFVAPGRSTSIRLPKGSSVLTHELDSIMPAQGPTSNLL